MDAPARDEEALPAPKLVLLTVERRRDYAFQAVDDLVDLAMVVGRRHASVPRMAVERKRDKNLSAGQTAEGPFVGAMLRRCWQRTRHVINEAVRAEGFTDLQEAHLAVFSYPQPDGIRLSELARRLNMSRQATNYLIGQLEQLDYFERRAAPGSNRRLIYSTKRGWKVAHTIYASMRKLQDQWADEVGRERFRGFMDVLETLSNRMAAK
jgi:DNA-binding MarR family transcriptional regulator